MANIQQVSLIPAVPTLTDGSPTSVSGGGSSPTVGVVIGVAVVAVLLVVIIIVAIAILILWMRYVLQSAKTINICIGVTVRYSKLHHST